MNFVYIGVDGQPEPPVVRDPLAQVEQVFAALEAQALQAATTVRFVGFDDELPQEEELAYCARCPHPMNPIYLDDEGVCEDCRAYEVRQAHGTPPFIRTEADWQLLVEHGYVDADDVPLCFD